MSPYIIMFAHFLISFVVMFFVYKAFASYSKLKISHAQAVLAALALTVPAYGITLLGIPAIAWVVLWGVILFFMQKSYIKDHQSNALLALKVSIILILVIILILFASSFILK